MSDIHYTHGHHESVLRGHRARTADNSAAYLLPHLRPGLALLDVGSGPGTITADLAARVAPGPVTALERTAAAMDLTRAALTERGIDAECAEGDVHDLPFPDDTFDVVHAHQVLQHVADPVLALREMGRVCRPGGLIAVRDADYGAFSWYPAEPALDDWLRLYRAAALSNGAQPDAGRRLLAWAHAAGFQHVTPSAGLWCYATPDQRDAWGGMWADRILASALSDQLIDSGAATPAELQRISRAWLTWAESPDGWMLIPHGELLIRVPNEG